MCGAGKYLPEGRVDGFGIEPAKELDLGVNVSGAEEKEDAQKEVVWKEGFWFTRDSKGGSIGRLGDSRVERKVFFSAVPGRWGNFKFELLASF